MNSFQKDRGILRSLAERYSEIANLDIQKERIERYYKTISTALQPAQESYQPKIFRER